MICRAGCIPAIEICTVGWDDFKIKAGSYHNKKSTPNFFKKKAFDVVYFPCTDENFTFQIFKITFLHKKNTFHIIVSCNKLILLIIYEI